MITLNKTKKSKYLVYVGWGLTLFTDNYNDMYDIRQQYGNEITIKGI